MPIRPNESISGSTKIGRPEPIKKGNDKASNPTGPGKGTPPELKQLQDGFEICTITEVKGNTTGGKPTITRAGNDECIVAPSPGTIVV